jgi:hypothetical protein
MAFFLLSELITDRKQSKIRKITKNPSQSVPRSLIRAYPKLIFLCNNKKHVLCETLWYEHGTGMPDINIQEQKEGGIWFLLSYSCNTLLLPKS